MAIIIKSHRETLPIDAIIGINQSSGNVLQGEKDMYERIVHDCEASPLTWYMWYDKTFNIPYGGQNEIQIDFLLICLTSRSSLSPLTLAMYISTKTI